MSVEFVGIELELRGEEGVYGDLRKIDSLLNSLRGRKKVDAGLQQLKKDIVAARGEIEKYRRELDRANQTKKKFGDSASAFVDRDISKYTELLGNAKNRLRDLQQAQREVTLASRQMGDTFTQTFSKITSRIAHVGSAMQSLGNGLVRLTSPFERLTTGLLYGAGYKALNMITEGLSGSFTRADTMSKYTRLMKEYEKANYSAAQSRQDLDDSIQGLPIALDEALALAQRYTLSLGDMERGTQLAIATNNAFLASMATESQRYQGMLQLQDLMNGKDLTSREWMSLGSSMGKAINEVGLQLGYGKNQLGEFRKELYAGEIASKDFLDALIAVGTGKGSLVSLAKVSAQTWEGLFSNMKIAVTRMGANILDTLNDTFKKATGRTMLQTLLGLDADGKEIGGGIKHWINDISASIQNWVKANPDKILDFFNAIKSIDWASIGKGVAQGLGEMVSILQRFGEMMNGRDLSGIGRWAIRLNMLGKALLIFGGITKGTRHITGGLMTLLVRGVRSFKKRGLLGMFGDLIAGESLYNVGESTEKIEKAVPTMGKLGRGLSKIFKGWAQVATMIGGSALVGAVSFKAFKSVFSDIKEIGDLVAYTDWNHAGKGLAGIGGFLVAFMALSKKLSGAGFGALKGGALLSGLTLMFAGTFWADMALIKRGFKAILDVSEYINTALDNFRKVKEIDGGVIGNISKAIGIFNQVTELLAIERNNPVTGEASGNLKELGKKSTKTVENLATALTSIKNAATSLNEINGMEIEVDNIEPMMGAMQTALDSVGTMIKGLPAAIRGAAGTDATGSLNQTITNIKSIFDLFIGENGILAQIPKLNEMIQGLVSEGQLTKMSIQMGTLGESLKGIWEKLNIGFSEGDFNLQQLTNLVQSLEQVRQLINKVNAIAEMEINTAGFGNISKAITGIKNAFNADAIAGIQAQIQAFVDTLNAALDQLRTIEEEIPINVTVKLADTFQTSVDSVIESIKKGKEAIKEQRSAVSFTIPVRVTFSLTTNFGSVMSSIASMKARISGAGGGGGGGRDYQGQSTGGYIYRAIGGVIPKRRGTDTIPTMLTPGEYVHNRKAVSFFGQDFMAKINRMDVRGALADLMMKAGSMASANAGTVINNYHYDNRNVTINNEGSIGAGFTFKQAGRALQAL